MSIIHPFSVDDLPTYKSQFSDSIPNIVRENPHIEVTAPKKKASKRCQTRTVQNDDEARQEKYTSPGSSSFNTTQSREGSFNLDVEAEDEEKEEVQKVE
nr:hypothetical protein [Tanacetum cinerariifolium]